MTEIVLPDVQISGIICDSEAILRQQGSRFGVGRHL